jgi:alkanesulfonate monooxygenase SsuD/methylene tetrahydromethanopterin reductase-like flavin-dependent oxidoreductase (luciferase family)
VTFAGRFYRLEGATLLPRPARRGGPPILIGGNGLRRTLPLVARYADIWNAVYLPVADFRERSKRLDELLLAAGRQPSEVKRSIMMPPPDLSAPDALRQQLSDYDAAGVDELIYQWLALDDIGGLRTFAEIALHH